MVWARSVFPDPVGPNISKLLFSNFSSCDFLSNNSDPDTSFDDDDDDEADVFPLAVVFCVIEALGNSEG